MKRFQALLDQLTLGLDNQTYTLEQSSELVCRHIQGELQCSQVSVWLMEERPEGATLRHQTGYDGPSGRVLVASHAVCRPDLLPYVQVLTQQGVFASDDALADERLGGLRETFLAPLDLRSVLYATIGTNGNTSALLACAERGGTRRWTAHEIRTLKACADAISLRRARRHRREAEAASLAQRLLQLQAVPPVDVEPGDAG
ncbi:MAG TPA: GAF domain-containing protein [Rhizobacter sp.]